MHNEKTLLKLNAQLEQRLEELSAELAAKNELLGRENTARGRAEEKLRASEETFSAIFNHLGLGIALISPDMEILFLNSIMEKLNPRIDVSQCPICYKSFNDPPLEAVCSYCPTIKTLRDGKVHSAVTDTPTANGIMNFKIITAPILAADGSVSAVIEVVEDITQHKRAEESLRESEERYRGLVELSPEAIYIHTGGKLIFANSAGAMLLGAQSPEELYGRAALDFVHPECRDFVRRRIENAFLSGKPNPPVEQLFVRLDGSPVPVEVASVPYIYGEGNALQVIARDITDRRKMQDEMLKAQKLESLGLLAGGIAHDFNNLLTGIIANLSMAKMQIDPAHGIVKRLELCEKAATQAGELTRQLLTFARGGEPVKRVISLASLIRDSVSLSLRGANVRSAIETDEDLWCLEADGSQLGQVLNNLLLNAVQAMPGGGSVTVTAANVKLATDNLHQLPPGGYIRISVADQGCGIAQQDLTRIFDPYFTTKPHGSGLGLASVYSIVRRHGGAIEVSSTQGVGSCFTIHLPALPGEYATESDEVKTAEPRGSGRILIMDDEDFIREIVSEILDYLGYEVVICADGREAVACFREAVENNRPFAAVILDLTVPGGMGGKEAAALMLEIDPAAILIVSSGYANDPVVANFRQFGFSGVVSKPFDANGLARELERLVGNRHKGDQTLR